MPRSRRIRQRGGKSDDQVIGIRRFVVDKLYEGLRDSINSHENSRSGFIVTYLDEKSTGGHTALSLLFLKTYANRLMFREQECNTFDNTDLKMYVFLRLKGATLSETVVKDATTCGLLEQLKEGEKRVSTLITLIDNLNKLSDPSTAKGVDDASIPILDSLDDDLKQIMRDLLKINEMGGMEFRIYVSSSETSLQANFNASRASIAHGKYITVDFKEIYKNGRSIRFNVLLSELFPDTASIATPYNDLLKKIGPGGNFSVVGNITGLHNALLGHEDNPEIRSRAASNVGEPMDPNSTPLSNFELRRQANAARRSQLLEVANSIKQLRKEMGDLRWKSDKAYLNGKITEGDAFEEERSAKEKEMQELQEVLRGKRMGGYRRSRNHRKQRRRTHKNW